MFKMTVLGVVSGVVNRKRSLGSLLPLHVSSNGASSSYPNSNHENSLMTINRTDLYLSEESTTAIERLQRPVVGSAKVTLESDDLIGRRNSIRKRQYRIALNFFNK